tara:strand:+ start:263 stop:499 length:237 start_codon:yes stop_codon:yes gene_type:complete
LQEKEQYIISFLLIIHGDSSYFLYSTRRYNLVISKRATKQETELRVASAAELVGEGQAYYSITSLVAAKYEISRRRAR